MTMPTVLKNQYHASLAMLRAAIDACPPAEWATATGRNAYWQIAYHTLFYTHFYLQPDESAFVPWTQHRPDYHRLRADADAARELVPYTPPELATYASMCDAMVDDAIDQMDLAAPESGFPWYRMSKLEHQLVNLRHIQHHTGQLADRLRQSAGHGTRWVGGRPELPA